MERGFEVKRAALTDQIADALLAAGVAQIPLRDLATALGTSDRMLLYYFEDKADLVRSSLEAVSARLADQLGAAFPAQRLPPGAFLTLALPLFASPAMAPFMTVWADLSARGGRGEAPFQALAQGSVVRWLAWLEDRLAAPEAERRGLAAAILAVLEGARAVEAAVPGSTAGVADLLNQGLGAQRGAVIFDRDGVLNLDVAYAYRPDQIVWTEDAAAAVRAVNDAGLYAFVATNQSGVARGYFTEQDVQALHAWMNQRLAEHGAHIDAFVYSPYHPDAVVEAYRRDSDCRKPGPGMILDLMARFPVDRARAVLIGDMDRDLQAARAAGIEGVKFEGGSLLAVVERVVSRIARPPAVTRAPS